MNNISSMITNYFIINNGKITVSTLRGIKHDVFITEDYKELYSVSGLGKNNKLDVLLFDGIVDFIEKNGGYVKKGNCRSSKVGEDKCTEDTLMYYIAKNYYKCSDGKSCFDPIFMIAAILDNIGICNNKYGYIEMR